MTVEPPNGPDLVAAARSAARLSKSIEVALADLGMSLPQYRLLAFLSGGPERASALADWLSVSPPSLTALVDGAVSKGLVERVAVQDDRRCVRHLMTDAGTESLGEAEDAVTTKIEGLLSHLSAAEARTAAEGLRLVGKALDAARAARDAATDAEAAERSADKALAKAEAAPGNKGGRKPEPAQP